MALADVIRSGTWDVLGLVKSGRCLAYRFFDDLVDVRERKRVLALWDRTAAQGPPRNREKSNKLTDDIFELKAYQTRFPYFYDGAKRIVLTHGVTKKKDRMDPDEIERAVRLRNEYLIAKRAGREAM